MRSDRLQLPLPFVHQPRYEACDFIPAESNRQALAWLESEWPDRRLALFGPAGCGKSHLLHMWAERTGAFLLSGQTLLDLSQLPEAGGFALDDADTVADETLLFHALNTARDRGLNLLLTARTAPSRWPVRLPDLSSRLRAIAAVEIRPPSDDLLAALLARLLSDRQLAASQAVRDWLLIRLPRSANAFREAVARLDRMSLAWRSPITRDMAAQLLADADFADAEGDEVSKSATGASSQPTGFL